MLLPQCLCHILCRPREEATLSKPPPIELIAQWKEKHAAHVDTLLRECTDFIVYLDRQLEVHWEDTKEYEAIRKKDGKDEVGKMQGSVTCLEAIPVAHLPTDVVRAARSITGEAICLALENDFKGAKVLVEKAEDFITARNHEHARKWYVHGSVLATILFVGLAATICKLYSVARPASADARLILMVGGGGAVGALFSILLRVGRAPLDPAAGCYLHHLEGAARILIGIIGAIAVVCAIRAELLFPQIKGSFGILLACVVAGASERFASSTIERVEGVLVREQIKSGTASKVTKS